MTLCTSSGSATASSSARRKTFTRQKFLEPGGLVTSPIDAFSLGLALMFGTAGLPHILMRFYTVPDAKAARKSVFVATGFIGYFYILTVTIGFGAAVLVGQKVIMGIDAGGNMAGPLLAEALGGNIFLGFLSAVAFATILAVVSGLTLAGASALSHDLYVGVIRRGVANEKEEVKVAKIATVGLGVMRDPARHPVQGTERRLPGRTDLRDRRQRQLPGAAPVHHLEEVHHLRGGDQHLYRPHLSPSSLSS